MRCGSASKSSCGRTSTSIGHFGVPISRTSLSIEIVFGAAMVRPFSFGAERDASALRLVGRSRSPWLNRGPPHAGCQDSEEDVRFGS